MKTNKNRTLILVMTSFLTVGALFTGCAEKPQSTPANSGTAVGTSSPTHVTEETKQPPKEEVEAENAEGMADRKKRAARLAYIEEIRTRFPEFPIDQVEGLDALNELPTLEYLETRHSQCQRLTDELREFELLAERTAQNSTRSCVAARHLNEVAYSIAPLLENTLDPEAVCWTQATEVFRRDLGYYVEKHHMRNLIWKFNMALDIATSINLAWRCYDLKVEQFLLETQRTLGIGSALR